MSFLELLRNLSAYTHTPSAARTVTFSSTLTKCLLTLHIIHFITHESLRRGSSWYGEIREE